MKKRLYYPNSGSTFAFVDIYISADVCDTLITTMLSLASTSVITLIATLINSSAASYFAIIIIPTISPIYTTPNDISKYYLERYVSESMEEWVSIVLPC